MFQQPLIKHTLAGAAALLATSASLAGGELYTFTNLGKPPGAYSAIGVRMNNLGHVAGWSQYFGQGEPSLKGWVWTPEDGFTVLPPPPGFFLGRSRAMDISDTGIVAGDGGFDIGLAWRYEDGTYTVTGGVQGMPGAYLGGINNAGDIAGTAKDGTITTPDFAWVDFNGGELLTIPLDGGRATDVNNVGQVTGSTQGPATAFQAFRWDQESGVQFLGSLGLAFSFANAMNDSGDVVGSARSATGNTTRAWIYTDELGMQELPAPFQNTSTAIHINNQGHVVGSTEVSGPDLMWLWTGGDSVTLLGALFDTIAANVNVTGVADINDAGQILASVFDNNVAEFRTVLLTPPTITMPEDVNGDGTVNVLDLIELLLCFGLTAEAPCGSADVTGDGMVNVLDLIELLLGFGASSP